MLAQAWPELEIVAECEDGASALEAIAERRRMSRFSISACPASPAWRSPRQRSRPARSTQVVFTTAYDQYAIDAFERGAVDYLLKPISPIALPQPCSG